MSNPVSNRNPAEWLRLCMDLELAEDFDDIFNDDKRVTAREAAQDLEDLMPDYLGEDDER